ncbi:MAG: hypothetical protein V7671_15275 [Parasphingorhabdus flavimaris]
MKEFDDKANPLSKVQVNVRTSRALLSEIDAECEYLGITRSSWFVLLADRELRDAKKERRIVLDPDSPKADA